MNQHKDIEILGNNIQIISRKQTLGEIYCVLLKENKPFHIEIAYKFYVYDPTVGNSFLEHWIGPNRRDSLVLKLSKMKQKQFSLLYRDVCKPILDDFNIKVASVKQRAFFKAQLFVPLILKFQIAIP